MSTTQDVTLDELIGRAETLLPAIADRALQTERDRRIPQETLDEIEAAGLNRILHPVRFGGYGLDYDAFFEISWRLSSACGSTGWIYSVSSVHHWQLGLSTEAAREDYFANGDVWSCSAFNPRGAKLEPVEGGYQLAGRWQYSSGCLHADWALLGAGASATRRSCGKATRRADSAATASSRNSTTSRSCRTTASRSSASP
jgi:3-hydroxy-9,10-secoandrosta-1,3,5(10)-triene-9,17-dione monooxygenase